MPSPTPGRCRKTASSGDAVLCDPPKFVLTREPAGSAEGRRKYEDLNQLGVSLVRPGGLFVTCSCSGLVSLEDFEAHVIKAAHRLNRRLQFFDRTGAGPDHPVTRTAPRAGTSKCSGLGSCEVCFAAQRIDHGLGGVRWFLGINSVRKGCHPERSEGTIGALSANSIQMDPSLRSG